jgi:hypothetical protein
MSEYFLRSSSLNPSDVDSRGAPRKHVVKEDLKRFYRVEDEEGKEEVGAKAQKFPKKEKKTLPQPKEDDSESESDSDAEVDEDEEEQSLPDIDLALVCF